MEKLQEYLCVKQKHYIIRGNGVTWCSWEYHTKNNNHKEADSLMAHLLKLSLDQFQNHDESVGIYSNDMDVFCILLSAAEELCCSNLLMKWSVQEWVKIEVVQHALKRNWTSAVAGFHAFTGCDTVGKFWRKTKEFWSNQFLKTSDDIMCAFETFAMCENKEAQFSVLQKFVIEAYSKKDLDYSLADVCWKKFAKMQNRVS